MALKFANQAFYRLLNLKKNTAPEEICLFIFIKISLTRKKGKQKDSTFNANEHETLRNIITGK